ncbi:hypothetical protein NX10_06745 [Pseudomonas fluorescens]|nr:hypothetical protein NX10_06745 [Pseudomonas fluorescens]
MRQPLTKLPMLRTVVIDQQCIHAGLTHHHVVLSLAISLHAHHLLLISVEFTQLALIKMFAHQPAQFMDTEPRLVLNQKGVQVAFVAGETSR